MHMQCAVQSILDQANSQAGVPPGVFESMGKRARPSQASSLPDSGSSDSSSSDSDSSSSSSSSEKRSKPEDHDARFVHQEEDAHMSDAEQDHVHSEWPDGPGQLCDLFDWSNRNADKLLKDADGDRIRNFMKIVDKPILHTDAYSGLGTASIACKCQLDGLLLKVNRHPGFRYGNNKQIPFGNLLEKV